MLRLTPCRCSESEWKRVQRSAWLRKVFPTRRLFQCSTCRRRFLVHPGASPAKRSYALGVLVFGTACTVSAAGLALWGRSSQAPPVAVPVAAAADTTQASRTSCHRVHVFKAGETLESIAQAELGDATKWQQIRIANREWLDLAENGLEPGARLTVPVPCPG